MCASRILRFLPSRRVLPRSGTAALPYVPLVQVAQRPRTGRHSVGQQIPGDVHLCRAKPGTTDNTRFATATAAFIAYHFTPFREARFPHWTSVLCFSFPLGYLILDPFVSHEERSIDVTQPFSCPPPTTALLSRYVTAFTKRFSAWMFLLPWGRCAMIATVSLYGKDIHVLTLADLGNTVGSGARMRAYCPLHGGDHQRSLSIDCTHGWGYCHNCHATVLLEEYNPAVAARLKQRGSLRLPARCLTPVSEREPPVARECCSRSGSADWQQEERAALRSLFPQMQATLSTSSRVQAYLQERHIAPQLAHDMGLAYLTQDLWECADLSLQQRARLKRWVGRLLFPLSSPDGWGCIGRSLWYWEPGMDENLHKVVLERRNMRRWLKTNPAGWFCPHPAQYAQTVILVEGGFDRLALVAAGIPANQVIALVGTAARPAWILMYAPQVKRIMLALDADSGGQEATDRLIQKLHEAGLLVQRIVASPDGEGKDWSERYRRTGRAGVWPLLAAIDFT